MQRADSKRNIDYKPFKPDRKRWGPRIVVSDGMNAWWARVDNDHPDNPVCYSRHPIAMAMLERGALVYKECVGCDKEELHWGDDYICCACRDDWPE